MSDRSDPPRILDTPDADFDNLREGLRAARAAGPSAAQLARMRAALHAETGALSPHGQAAEPASAEPANAEPDMPAGDAVTDAADFPSALAAQPGGGLLKLLGLGVLLGAGFWVFLYGGEQAPAAELAPPRLPTTSAPRAALPSATSTGATRADPTGTPPMQDAPSPAAAVSVEAEQGALAEPSRPRRRKREARVAAQDGAAHDARSELALLQRARAHVRSAPARALALVAQHERTYQPGRFAEEREVIAIEALVHAGELDAAEARAARFRSAHPESAHLRRIAALLSEAESD